jgi:WhiB family redox-sensing transcriptional regulator
VSQLDTLLAMLAGAPSLPGARCRGRHHLFDEAAPNEKPETVAARHAQAIGLCRNSCPSLTRCEAWFLGLKPSKRPLGVVAGQINLGAEDRERRPPGRPRTTAVS